MHEQRAVPSPSTAPVLQVDQWGPASPMKPTVGVVDDDASVQRALRRLLRAADFSVETFGSAEEVLSSGHLQTFRCLVLDVHLGDLSGFDVQERLPDRRPPIPVIFITAHDTALTRERAKRVGAVDYLRKPFDDSALIGAIHRALARS